MERTKEELARLRMILALLFVTDVSLVAWIAQNYDRSSFVLLGLAMTIACIASAGVGLDCMVYAETTGTYGAVTWNIS